MTETTDDHFQFFVNSVEHYCDQLKISGWDIRFKHEFVANGFTATAADADARIVEFRLTTEWRNEIVELTDEQLDHCAKHEAGHLFNWRLFDMIKRRFIIESEVDTLDEEYAIRIAGLL